MRVLVDEGMPVQVIPSLRLNRRHQFDHVDDLGWKGKPDVQLFTDAANRGFHAVAADGQRRVRQRGRRG
jgi:predicted nuclease of predicted toxin-antitoxin system